MKFLRKAMAIVNFNRWKILFYISMCINILLSECSILTLGQSGKPHQKPNYPGTKSNQRLNDVLSQSSVISPRTNQTPSLHWRFPSEKTFPADQKIVTKKVPTSEVFNKQNYHHNEASPISPLVVPDSLSLTLINESRSVGNTNSSLQIDKKPFQESHFNDSIMTSPLPSPEPTLSISGVLEEPDEEPFEQPITLRIGAFFEGSEIETMSSKLFFSLRKEISKLEDEFRASKLMKLDLNSDDTVADIDGVLRELQFSSVFGNVDIEGLVMEPPSFDKSSVTRMCKTLLSKNVFAAIGLGTSRNNYAASLLTHSAKIPFVTSSYTGYSDEEVFQDLFPYVIQTNPRLKDLWSSATSVIYSLNLYQPVLIHDTSYRGLTLSHIASRDESHNTLQISLNPDLPRVKFHSELSSLLNTDRRVLFLCGTLRFISRTVEHGKTLGMFDGEFVWLLLDANLSEASTEILIPGLLNIHPSLPKDQQSSEAFIRSSLSVILRSLKDGVKRSALDLLQPSHENCLVPSSNNSHNMSEEMNNFLTELETKVYSESKSPSFSKTFHIENLVPNKTVNGTRWIRVGTLIGQELDVEALYWPGRGFRGVDSPTKQLRVAMVTAPPFVMTSQLIDNSTCLIGVVCLKVFSKEVGATFEDWEDGQRHQNRFYKILCCNGLSVDLMINLATDLKLKLQVYIVMDGTFGAPRMSGWTGIIGDILDGSAHLSVAPLSVTSQRAKVIDFSGPYFYSSMVVLSSTRKMETPLLAFLVPFSPELWVAIFISLNVTALAVAIYEWLSPFGLNPWGRQRSKNFSYGSALWVIWGLLFSHLVAFKAPKSWPNKVLINVWGAFSVIFVASYTANIAALFAGLFNRRDTHDKSFYALKMGAVRQSSSEFYFSLKEPSLWAHIKNNLVDDYSQALEFLLSGKLELLAGDAAFLDHMRANDPGCTLQSAGTEAIADDTFAVGMPKGFPLKREINSAISQYVASGHLEYLRHKWYGSTPCFRLTADIYKPQPLEFQTVAGVFLMLTLGILIGIIILLMEHVVYRYALPSLRTKPKDSVWRNRNLMFFSQKLYKFINCVELVSPHHSAKELANNLRTGQIMGLFQKSVKRKENEQRRRRKSKAQFFEMIQEIRSLQKAERSMEGINSSAELLDIKEDDETEVPLVTSFIAETSPLTNVPLTSPFTPPITSNLPYTSPSTHPQSSSTTISSPVSSSTRRHSSIHLSAGVDKADQKSPPGITIEYIPGPNPTEDYEGLLIVNKSFMKKSRRTSSENSEALKKHQRDPSNSRKNSKTSNRNTSEDEYPSVYVSPTIKVEKADISRKEEKEANRKKRRRKLERSSRVDNSIESLKSTEDGSYEEHSHEKDSIVDVLQVPNEQCNRNVVMLSLAVSAPASLFGDSTCLCNCHTLELDSSQYSQEFFGSNSCENCFQYHSHLPSDFKSKSLDDTKIEPPSDFMCPIVSPSVKESTSISFPCSPHTLESPTAEKSPLLHFLSEGDSRWRDWEGTESRQAPDLDCEMDSVFYSQSCDKNSPSGYQSSGSFHYGTPESPNNHSNEPTHLRKMTKSDIWKLWQDSELELRHKLHQLQEEKNQLATQLSKSFKKSHRRSKPQHFTYEGSSFEMKQISPNQPLEYELEVPPEFRDSTSKELRKNRICRSLEEGRAYKTTKKESKNAPQHLDSFEKVAGIQDAYNDLYRSVKSLEDSLLETTENRIDSRRRSKHSLGKTYKKKRESRRCKSSLDARRRSHSLLAGTPSDSSGSPKTERIELRRIIPRYDFKRSSFQDPDSPRESRREKCPMSSSLEPSEKFSSFKDFRRRRSKTHKEEKVDPFTSLPRPRPDRRRKVPGYYSSSSDDETFYSGRRYIESSPLPLLQSLQRHSMGKQKKNVVSQKSSPSIGSQKPDIISTESFDSSHKKKSSGYVDRPAYSYDGFSGAKSSVDHPSAPLLTSKKFASSREAKVFGSRSSFETREQNLGDPF